jgi:hypothetical protein
MGNAFTASGSPAPSPELALAGYNSVYTENASNAASFAGYTAGNTHLQTTPTADTSSVVVSATANQRVVITGLVAHSNQNNVALGTLGTFAAEGSDDDLLIYQSSGYGNFYASNLNIPLPKGKDLIHYRVRGVTGGLNSVSVTYKVVPA